MKLKTKSKILLGTLIMSGMLSQVGNSPSLFGISDTVKAVDPPAFLVNQSLSSSPISNLYSLLSMVQTDDERDYILRAFGDEYHLSPVVSGDLSGDGMAGYTLMHLAARDNNVELFDYLLSTFDQYHDIFKQQNIYGETPLHVAVVCGSLDVIKMAVRERVYDIDFDLRDYSGRTLSDAASEMAMYAGRSSKSRSMEISEILRSGRAIARIVDDHSRSLDDAIRFLSPDTINMKVCDKFGNSDSLLTYAVTHGGYDLAYALITKGAERDPEVWGSDEKEANFDIWNDIFMHCASHGSTDDLEFLLRENPFGMDFGKSFLDDAVCGKNTDNFRLLLENTNPGPDELDAAMSACVEKKNYECAEILIREKGYDINKVSDIDGKTLLHNATDEQDMKKAVFLIALGADPSIKDARGRLAIDSLESAEDKREFEDSYREAKAMSEPSCKRPRVGKKH